MWNARRIQIHTHLLPNILLLGQRLQRLVQRIHNDLAHRHIPRPRFIHSKLFQEIDERFFRLDVVVEPGGGDDRFRAEVGEGVVDGIDAR